MLGEPSRQELGQEFRRRLEGQDVVQVVMVEFGIQELLERRQVAEVRHEARTLQRGRGEDYLDLVAVAVLP